MKVVLPDAIPAKAGSLNRAEIYHWPEKEGMARVFATGYKFNRSRSTVTVQDLNCGQMRALTAVAFFDLRSFSGGGSEGWLCPPKLSEGGCPGATAITNLS
jgi:hypothetical protein